jgi:hypothetical protein
MSLQIIELCRGTGCTLAPYCYDYRLPVPAIGYAIKERIPTQPGDRCPDFKSKRKANQDDMHEKIMQLAGLAGCLE